MIVKILHNNYVKKVVLTEIRTSKNKEFFIWNFKDETDAKFVGFTPCTCYYGGKTHIWYSLLTGHFLPESYNINFDNIIGKECVIILGQKGVARGIIPVNISKKDNTINNQDYEYNESPSYDATKDDENFVQEPDENLFT